VAVTIDAGAEARVRELLAVHRPELERLVDQALERELTQLVEQRLAARNGNGADQPVRNSAVAETAAATKICAGPYGRALPVSAFEKGRAKCRECPRAEHRDREQRRAVEQAAAEPERPAGITADELARRADRYAAACADELERWLLDGQLAKRTPLGLVPTPLAVELGAGIT
jgi:hypothetical protein